MQLPPPMAGGKNIYMYNVQLYLEWQWPFCLHVHCTCSSFMRWLYNIQLFHLRMPCDVWSLVGVDFCHHVVQLLRRILELSWLSRNIISPFLTPSWARIVFALTSWSFLYMYLQNLPEYFPFFDQRTSHTTHATTHYVQYGYEACDAISTPMFHIQYKCNCCVLIQTPNRFD